MIKYDETSPKPLVPITANRGLVIVPSKRLPMLFQVLPAHPALAVRAFHRAHRTVLPAESAAARRETNRTNLPRSDKSF